jgi:hypothetical protein
VQHFIRTLHIKSYNELRQVDHRAVIAWERIMRETDEARPSTRDVLPNRSGAICLLQSSGMAKKSTNRNALLFTCSPTENLRRFHRNDLPERGIPLPCRGPENRVWRHVAWECTPQVG